jgi:hypothetical protein
MPSRSVGKLIALAIGALVGLIGFVLRQLTRGAAAPSPAQAPPRSVAPDFSGFSPGSPFAGSPASNDDNTVAELRRRLRPTDRGAGRSE